MLPESTILRKIIAAAVLANVFSFNWHGSQAPCTKVLDDIGKGRNQSSMLFFCAVCQETHEIKITLEKY